MSTTVSASLLVGLGLVIAACGGGQAPATSSSSSYTPPPEASGSPSAPAADAPLTAARCQAAGGKVVGDIGNGAIHRPDYRCESGKAPLGSIVAETGQPVGIEGSVCCP